MAELKVKIVLIDIEGTTTSISFVHDVLFPYAKTNAKAFLEGTWQSEETKQIVQDLQQATQYAEYISTSNTLASSIDAELITGFVHYLIEKDLKVTPLKTLQGLIWAKGYADGQLKGHVYDDVPAAFHAWRDGGLSIAVFSSGSVAAQKLIFGNSTAGNLLPHLSAHFDTHIGHKQERQSYLNIADQLNVVPKDVLFLTDVVGEAAAARDAGMQTIILRRPGNAPLTTEQKAEYTIVDDFKALGNLKVA